MNLLSQHLAILLASVAAFACTPAPCACPAYGSAPLAASAEAEPAAPTSPASEPKLRDSGVSAKSRKGGRPKASDGDVARTEDELVARYEGKKPRDVLQGKATYYGDSLAGHKTANGDRYDPKAFTAAHRTLPFNTIVRVVREDTQRYVYVRINDRGPFGNAQRIIDLSKIAAERLGMLRAGVVKVRVEVLE